MSKAMKTAVVFTVLLITLTSSAQEKPASGTATAPRIARSVDRTGVWAGSRRTDGGAGRFDMSRPVPPASSPLPLSARR